MIDSILLAGQLKLRLCIIALQHALHCTVFSPSIQPIRFHDPRSYPMNSLCGPAPLLSPCTALSPLVRVYGHLRCPIVPWCKVHPATCHLVSDIWSNVMAHPLGLNLPSPVQQHPGPAQCMLQL